MTPRDPDVLTVPPDGRPAEEQPRWRRDFPIDWPEDRYISQRDFIKFLVLTSLAFVTGQFGLVFKAWRRAGTRLTPEREIASVDAVPVGGSLVFRYPEASGPCVLVRLAEQTFVAYDQQCTHLLCPVIPRPEEGVFRCPCHEGVFDMRTGRPLSGPPRRPLPRVVLHVRNGKVYAVFPPVVTSA